jgi:ACS family hexuronate transporter-like MFS transporter
MKAAAIGKYRWTICTLLFFATTINYLDRQVLSLLKPTLEKQFDWSNSDYANIASVFQFVYALSMLFAGRIVDKLGTKWGYAWAIIIWSFAAIIHAFAIPIGTSIVNILGWVGIAAVPVSIAGFMFSRALLGFGEAGNFPAAIKTTAEYFPKKERAFATGIFNSGTNVGAILAPLSVPWIALHWGWEAAFIIIGAIGFLWLIAWFIFYEIPAKQTRLSAAEKAFINSDNEVEAIFEKGIQTNKISWLTLLKFKQTWAFAIGKFLTDGVWWFFLFWLPSYLKEQYGMEGTQIIIPLSVLYSLTMIGSIGGGWFPTYFINKGAKPYEGRMKAMLLIAFIPLVVLFVQPLGYLSFWIPVLLIGIGASAHQAWSANIYTTVSDMFPKRSIATVIGMGGMAGGMGGVVVSKIGGWLFDAYKLKGIQQAIESASFNGMQVYMDKIKSISMLDANGELIYLVNKEWSNLPANTLEKLQTIDPIQFEKFIQMQKLNIHDSMSLAYGYMFIFCAIAYLLAWRIMKWLVPREKLINLA